MLRVNGPVGNKRSPNFPIIPVPKWDVLFHEEELIPHASLQIIMLLLEDELCDLIIINSILKYEHIGNVKQIS